MRTTQFIGLTTKCKEIVSKLTRVDSPSWNTFGMFEEEIPLGVYYHPSGTLACVEYVQASPWSSGPMIFTGLLTPEGPCIHNWKESPEKMEEEYNPDTGLYWV